MKKKYSEPAVTVTKITLSSSLLTASGSNLPDILNDDITAGGDESLSRRRRRIDWDDEEE